MRQFLNNPVALMLLLFMAYSSIRSGAFDDPGQWLMNELMILPGILVGLSFHEYAHAMVAYKLGDDTPRFQNRLTVNPVAHIDPIGFIALLFVGFGWGKPVEINPRNFKNMRRDELMVSLAGVVMNLFIATIFTIALGLFMHFTGAYTGFGSIPAIISNMMYYCIYINLVLMVFNLLPIPPLDGFNVVTELFDLRRYDWWHMIYAYGNVILIFLIAFNFTDRILLRMLNPLMDIAQHVIMGLM